jgi:hypothetical protein
MQVYGTPTVRQCTVILTDLGFPTTGDGTNCPTRDRTHTDIKSFAMIKSLQYWTTQNGFSMVMSMASWGTKKGLRAETKIVEGKTSPSGYTSRFEHAIGSSAQRSRRLRELKGSRNLCCTHGHGYNVCECACRWPSLFALSMRPPTTQTPTPAPPRPHRKDPTEPLDLRTPTAGAQTTL